MSLLYTTKTLEQVRRDLQARLKAKTTHIKYSRAIGRGKQQEIRR